MKYLGVAFLLVFGLFWSGATLTFDVMIVKSFWQRIRADSFPTVVGTIIKSQVRTSKGRKGSSSYRPDILYRYELGDRRFSCSRYQFGDFTGSDSAWTYRVVGEFPVGKEVPIHYDPADPGSAALATGLDGSEIFMTLFLTPFNCIMLTIWTVPLSWCLGKWRAPVAGGVKLEIKGNLIRANVHEFGPMAAGLVAIGFAAFISIFVVGFATNSHPSVAIALINWLVVLGVGAGMYIRRYRKIRTGVEDLWIDYDAGTMSLPCRKERKQVVQVKIEEVEALRIETVAHQGSKGGTTYSYAPTLCLANGREEKVADWYDEPKAKKFTSWLEERILSRGAPPKRSTA